MDRSPEENEQRIPFWSESLWKKIAGKVDYSFKSRLEWLDTQQYLETISPQLAEAIRIVIHQAVAEETTLKSEKRVGYEKSLSDILMRAIGVPGLKFIMTQLEGETAHRIRKAAETVESQTGLPSRIIMDEYFSWIARDEG